MLIGMKILPPDISENQTVEQELPQKESFSEVSLISSATSDSELKSVSHNGGVIDDIVGRYDNLNEMDRAGLIEKAILVLSADEEDRGKNTERRKKKKKK